MIPDDQRDVTRDGAPRKQIHTHKRQELVHHYAIMYGTASPTEIRDLIKRDTGYVTSRITIHKDLQKLNEQVSQWTHGQARSQWMARIQRMYVDTNLQILNLQDAIKKLVETDPQIPDTILQALASIPAAKDQKEAVRILEKLVAAAQAQRYGGKMSYMISTMLEAQKHLVEIMTGGPLYTKLQEYSKLHDMAERATE